MIWWPSLTNASDMPGALLNLLGVRLVM
jgi:hypothetical protein